MKECKGCHFDKIPKSFRYDDDLCSICYTEERYIEWTENCRPWLRKCTKCPDTENVFTHYLRVKMSGLYPSICHKCQKKGNREYRRESYIPDSMSVKRIGVVKVLSKADQKKFVKRWDKMEWKDV